MEPQAGSTISLRGFARRLHVSPTAVRKGIGNGRLEASVGVDSRGRAVILDVVLAMREWRENRDPSKVRP